MTQFDKSSFFRMGQNHGLACKPPISQASTYRRGYEDGLNERHYRLFEGVPKVSNSDLRYLHDAPFPGRGARPTAKYTRFSTPPLSDILTARLYSDTMTGPLNALNSTPPPVVGDEIPAITMRWVDDVLSAMAENTVTPEVNRES